MSKAVEIVKMLVSPANKLIDAVAGAIGKAYQPRHIRKLAEAKAYEINTIGQALRNNADVPIVYDKGDLSLNTTDFDEFVKRTQSRLAYQELQKQQNIENVADKAYELLSTETAVSSEPVSKDWMTRFFNSVEDISDEDLQNLWAKVLAGEIVRPKSFSLRTLETLKNISKYEAELFVKILPYVLTLENSLFLNADRKLLLKHGITYGEIMALDECGLINSSGFVVLTPKVSTAKPVGIHNRSQLVLLRGLSASQAELTIGIFGLTQAGRELYKMLNVEPNGDYICDFAKELVKNNAKKIKATIHMINFLDAKGINFDNTVLEEFPLQQ